MKLIMDNLIQSATATNEDAAYPVENIFDEHPQKVFKTVAVPDSALKSVVTILSASDCNAICIVNTNATMVRITIKNTSTGVKVWPLVDDYAEYDLSGIDNIFPLMHDIKIQYKDLWVDYTHQKDPVTIEISFYLTITVGTIVYCGVIVNGLRQMMREPQYGITESLIDTSIIKWTSNQSLYYRKRNVVRKYSGTIMMDRESELFFFMRYIAMRKGPAPMAWALVGENSQTWIVYGTMAGAMPSANHDNYKFSTMNFSIQEVI
jgi:hypothetical protein